MDDWSSYLTRASASGNSLVWGARRLRTQQQNGKSQPSRAAAFGASRRCSISSGELTRSNQVIREGVSNIPPMKRYAAAIPVMPRPFALRSIPE